jgi:hypothetical protein
VTIEKTSPAIHNNKTARFMKKHSLSTLEGLKFVCIYVASPVDIYTFPALVQKSGKH